MTLEEGRDFVMADNITYVGPAGMGKGCLVGTHDRILIVPIQVSRVGGYIRYRTETTTFTLQGENPAEMIRNYVTEAGVTSADFNSLLQDIVSQVEGAVLHELSEVRRLKVKNSLFSRGIYLNKNDSNVGWTGYPLKKPDALAFEEFYRGHPAAQQ